MRSDRIVVKGITAHGFHGVYPEEQSKGQKFIVDVALEVDLFEAATSDSLAAAVDYSKVIARVHQLISGEPYNLIEALAQAIAATILNEYELVDSLEVTVHKPEAPVGLPVTDIAVEIFRRR
jgi:dihydroneopterin aldolase